MDAKDGFEETARGKYAALISSLAKLKSAAVAFSGGVDSSFLCHCAVKALGAENTLAITVVSPMLAKTELESAREIARITGIPHILLAENGIDDGVAANPKDRCYHCKKLEFGAIIQAAGERGIEIVLDGSNADDEGDYRPGLRAVAELRVQSPLREARINKEEIRFLSREAALPTWNKPACACLASRFPYGERFTVEKIKRVEKAEELLRERGFVQFRVRSHGNIARIEVAREERGKFFDEALLDSLSARLKALGFVFAAFELEGYRTGSLNAELERT